MQKKHAGWIIQPSIPGHKVNSAARDHGHRHFCLNKNTADAGARRPVLQFLAHPVSVLDSPKPLWWMRREKRQFAQAFFFYWLQMRLFSSLDHFQLCNKHHSLKFDAFRQYNGFHEKKCEICLETYSHLQHWNADGNSKFKKNLLQ